MKHINAITFKEKIESDPQAVIIDVRTPEEEAEGLIPNSININLMDPDFPQKALELEQSKNYYIYCRAGGRSATACEFMSKNGYTTFNLEGGIQAWNSL